MKAYSIFEAPIKVFGIPNFERNKSLSRLPNEVIEKIPTLDFLGRRVPGGRIGFKTDSKVIGIRAKYKTLSPDVGMSIYSCQSFHVFVGDKQNSRFLGLMSPYDYQSLELEGTLTKDGIMEEVLILLPRNEIIESVEILLDDDATLLAPNEYKYSKPIVYYGSSITEGGIACNPSNAYNAIISRHLNVDYINLGFSGNAKGEIAMADYINTLDFSILVYDYDHNAPTPEHLEKTHEPFFKRIREKHPNVPVLMLTRPYANYGSDEQKRKSIVKTTYENAIKNGDKNVYFIDGESYFNDFEDKELCFIDTIHPNDLGFYKMAQKIEPIIKDILENENN